MALHALLERTLRSWPHIVQQQREVRNMIRMLFTYRLWVLIALLPAGSLLLSGQTVQSPDIPSRVSSDFLDPKQGVSEDELVTRALSSNPALAAQRQQIAMAKGDVTQARLHKNPSLTLGGLQEVKGDD